MSRVELRNCVPVPAVTGIPPEAAVSALLKPATFAFTLTALVARANMVERELPGLFRVGVAVPGGG